MFQYLRSQRKSAVLLRESKKYLGMLILILFLSFSFIGGTAQATEYENIFDNNTGISLDLPLQVIYRRQSHNWGTSWATPSKHLDIGVLNFGDQRSLTDLYYKLKDKTRRRITYNQFENNFFILRGIDKGRTDFYLALYSKESMVKGISISSSVRYRKKYARIIRHVISSFKAFPAQHTPSLVAKSLVAKNSVPAKTGTIRSRTPTTFKPAQSMGDRQSAQIKILTQKLQDQSVKLKEMTAQIISRQQLLKRKARQAEQETRISRTAKLSFERYQQEQNEFIKKLKADRQTWMEELKKQDRERQKALRKQAALNKELDRLKAQKFNPNLPDDVANLPSGNRIALVIGINDYEKLSPESQLKTAVNDAELMAETLKKLHFEVVSTSLNVTREQFYDHWDDFLNRMDNKSVAALFFAGHGVRLGNDNYLLPKDIPALKPNRMRSLRRRAINFTGLLHDIKEKKPQLSLVILDACRNDPFQLATRGLGLNVRGITPVTVNGTFTMYSANDGQQALDRLPEDAAEEKNSLYTRSLVPLMLSPGLTIQQVAQRVRRSVAFQAKKIGHIQEPTYNDELNQRLCLMCNDRKVSRK